MKRVKIVVLFLFILFLSSFFIIFFKNKKVLNVQENLISEIEKNIDNSEKEEKNEYFDDGTIGIIIIPSLNIEAPIIEGVGAEVLKYAVRSF